MDKCRSNEVKSRFLSNELEEYRNALQKCSSNRINQKWYQDHPIACHLYTYILKKKHSKTKSSDLSTAKVGSSHASFQLRPPEMAKNNVNIASGTDPHPALRWMLRWLSVIKLSVKCAQYHCWSALRWWFQKHFCGQIVAESATACKLTSLTTS